MGLWPVCRGGWGLLDQLAGRPGDQPAAGAVWAGHFHRLKSDCHLRLQPAGAEPERRRGGAAPAIEGRGNRICVPGQQGRRIITSGAAAKPLFQAVVCRESYVCFSGGAVSCITSA